MTELTSEERLLLMRFVCSFAWADLEVRAQERAFVHRLTQQLSLSPDEIAQVNGWLHTPPPPEDIDPQDIPVQHRRMFLAAAQAMIAIDGEVDEEELNILDLFISLLADDDSDDSDNDNSDDDGWDDDDSEDDDDDLSDDDDEAAEQ